MKCMDSYAEYESIYQSVTSGIPISYPFEKTPALNIPAMHGRLSAGSAFRGVGFTI